MKVRVLLVMLFLQPSVILAQGGWEKLGDIYGGPVTALSSDENNNLYAGTQAGIFKSVDNGESWSELIGIGCSEIIVDDQNQIYAVTLSDFLITSSNGGVSFEVIGALPGSYSKLRKIGQKLFAFSNPYSNMEVFVSENEGLTWTQTYSFNHQVIGSIRVSDQSIFISDGGGGLYRSDDFGTSFIEKNDGINESYGGPHSVVSFAEDSNGILYRLSQQEVYASANKGESWVKITLNLTYPFYGLITLNETDEVILLNHLTSETFKFNQNTQQWILMSSVFPLKNDVPTSEVISTPAGLFFASSRGIYKGSQNGQAWEGSNKNIQIPFFRGLGITKDSVLVVSSDIGVSKFVDNDWSTIPTTTTGHLLYPGRLFTFSNGFSLLSSGYLSTNGIAWNHIEHYFSQIIKGQNGNLYGYMIEFINSVQTPLLFKSIDAGETWETIDIDGLPLLNLTWNGMAANQTDVYLVGHNDISSSYELYKINLTSLSANKIYSANETLSSVEVKNESIYLNSGSGLNRSDDYGSTWKMIFTAIDPTGEIGNIAPYYGIVGKTIWVGGFFGEIKYSIDKGETWIERSIQIGDKNARANNFIADRKGHIYVTITEFGVIKSMVPILESDLLDPLEDEIITAIEEASILKPMIYPNPVGNQLFVIIPNDNNEPIKIGLYNLHGQKILSSSSNSQEFCIDLFSVSPGLYLLEITGNHQPYFSKVLKK